MKNASRVSLAQVAATTGVSRMTVSLALRDHPSLPKATRHRIQEVAARLGYQADPDIAKLMERIRARKTHGVRNVIGYLTAHDQPQGWVNEPTQRMYYEGAQQRAEEYGYHLQEFWLREPGMTESRLSDIIRNRGIEGVLVAPVPFTQDLYRKFHWDYVSAVELGYSLTSPRLHRCCNHQFQSMMRLLEGLRKAGYREIGLAMASDQDERVNHNWKAAYLVGQSLLPGVREIPILLADDWNQGVFSRWLRQSRPEVVVTIGPEVGRWLKELRLRVPRDVGLANVDLRPDMKDVTGIDQESRRVGAAAIDSLTTLIRINQRGIPAVPQVLMLEGRFVQGKTTRRG